MVTPADLSYEARFQLRLLAYLNGYCCTCGTDVNPADLTTPDERAGWEVSAKCPACIDGRDGEECAND